MRKCANALTCTRADPQTPVLEQSLRRPSSLSPPHTCRFVYGQKRILEPRDIQQQHACNCSACSRFKPRARARRTAAEVRSAGSAARLPRNRPFFERSREAPRLAASFCSPTALSSAACLNRCARASNRIVCPAALQPQD
eukprot:6174034-Pleurochrysis_carterae.AAC.3